MMSLFGILLALLGAVGAYATPSVKQITINGFQVYLLNMKSGSEFGYAFGVPYGSSDDPSEYAGRAHFFEHMYSRGSLRYPGHETLIRAFSGFGFNRNASTGPESTIYFGYGPEKNGLEAMRMHLAGLDGIELEASSFAREKKTVIDEVVDQAPANPARAQFVMATMVAPREGHPQRFYALGERDVLERMSADNLRDLLRSVYHAGNVRLAVFGNFTSGLWSEAQVIEELRASLPKEVERLEVLVRRWGVRRLEGLLQPMFPLRIRPCLSAIQRSKF